MLLVPAYYEKRGCIIKNCRLCYNKGPLERKKRYWVSPRRTEELSLSIVPSVDPPHNWERNFCGQDQNSIILLKNFFPSFFVTQIVMFYLQKKNGINSVLFKRYIISFSELTLSFASSLSISDNFSPNVDLSTGSKSSVPG